MRSTKLLAALVAAMIGAAGCSQDEAAPTTLAETSASTSSSTTTTTTTAPTTETTVDPIVEAEAAVEAAYLRAYEVFTNCYRTLPDCDPAVAFSEVYTGGTYERLTHSAARRKADGLVYEPPEDPAYARTEIIGITVDTGLGEAVVSFCTLAGDTELAVSPDGSRIPVGFNETVLVAWGDAEMVLGDDGVWRITDYPDDVGDVVEVRFDEIDERLEEGVLCGGSLDA